MIDDPSASDNPRAERPDAVLSRVMDLVGRTHVARASLDAGAMLRAAWALQPGGTPAPAFAGSVADLAAPLSLLLDGGGTASRNERRARLLDSALKAADRWSSARTGRTRSDQHARRTGEIAGVGVRIGRRGADVRVVGVVPASGAAEAGLVAGDVLLAVEGLDAGARSIADLLLMLRGPAGSRVSLTTSRSAPQALSVVRRALPQPSTAHSVLGPGEGVLRIERMTRRTPGEAAVALRRLRSAGARAIVIDLRGNTGGSMLGAAAVADLFLSSGLIAEALDEDDREVPGLKPRVEATSPGDETTRLAVLVDRRTASSAELLAASLAWNGRAPLVGETTFGKGVVGKPHAFDECDLTVTITSALMRAAGRRLPAGGLSPDVATPPSGEAAVREALRCATPRG